MRRALDPFVLLACLSSSVKSLSHGSRAEGKDRGLLLLEWYRWFTSRVLDRNISLSSSCLDSLGFFRIDPVHLLKKRWLGFEYSLPAIAGFKHAPMSGSCIEDERPESLNRTYMEFGFCNMNLDGRRYKKYWKLTPPGRYCNSWLRAECREAHHFGVNNLEWSVHHIELCVGIGDGVDHALSTTGSRCSYWDLADFLE